MMSASIPGAKVVARRPARSDVLVVITGRNERRHVTPLFSFYEEQGVDVAYLDDGSTDGTLDLVASHLGAPVVWVGSKPFERPFDLAQLLRMKESLMRQAPHAWLIHADMDEYRRAPDDVRLADALARVAAEGANAVNFQEFTFVPVLESPHHDHPEYRTTMRWYYAFRPREHHRLNAFMPSRLPDFDLVSESGHRLLADGLRVFKDDFVMEHFPFLSLAHFREVYIGRVFSDEDVQRGWHGTRTDLGDPALCPAAELNDRRVAGLILDRARTTHPWVVQKSRGEGL